MIELNLYQIHETPNAVMHTLAAPSTGTTDLAVWTVDMRAGQSGPEHAADQEQVWVVLEGALTISGAELTGVATIPAGARRQIAAITDARALVASRAPATVATADGARPLPWAQ